MQFGRYRVFCWDELLRVWCEDCGYNDDDLAFWPENDPVDLGEIVAACTAHELSVHSG